MSLSQKHLFPDVLDHDSFDSDDCRSVDVPPSSDNDNDDNDDDDDEDMRSSPSPAPSLYSLTSSILIQSFRNEFGREMNNYSEVYRLPADAEELDRLDKQHELFMHVMGKYPPPLADVLAQDDSGEMKTCLDLGCGSGTWIMDVAREFPHTNCVAVDLVPMQSPYMPMNCRAEVDDINLGLQHFYGDFNVVHARLISSGIRDYAGLLDELSRVLRPGGLLDLTENDFRIYDSDKQPVLSSPLSLSPSACSPSNPPQSLPSSPFSSSFPMSIGPFDDSGPWLPRFIQCTSAAARARGGNIDAAALLHRWTLQHPAFTHVVYREYWVPVSPWVTGDDPESMKLREWGGMLAKDLQTFLRSARPLLLGNGMPEEILDYLEDKTWHELEDASAHLYVKIQNVYARRK